MYTAMYTDCERYLAELLQAAGVKTRPVKSLKELETKVDSHVAGIIHGATELQRGDGEYVDYTGADGARIRRYTLWRRTIEYDVILGARDAGELETIYTVFLAELPKRFDTGGDYTEIDVGPAEWVTDGDSILRAKVAVRQPVRFSGRICRDVEMGKIDSIDFAVEKNETEDKINGK